MAYKMLQGMPSNRAAECCGMLQRSRRPHPAHKHAPTACSQPITLTPRTRCTLFASAHEPLAQTQPSPACPTQHPLAGGVAS